MAGYAGGEIVTAVAEQANAVQELVLDAVESGTPLRVSGRSHWMNAGRPVRATRIASLAAHSGIVDYVPGDLTITVRSGTTLEEIRSATEAEAQWLPLEPFGTGDGTIGATIATGSFGPLAHGFGRARDLVLGLEFVTGEGKVVRGGGRVVKNVAGFDLVRLLTGSWGTLGIVTEATLRLYARPSRPVTVALNVNSQAGSLAKRLATISTAPLAAFAFEIISSQMAVAVGLPASTTILVRLGGNSASVAAQRATLAALGGMTDTDDSVWNALRTVEDAGAAAATVRFSATPSRLAGLWNSVTSQGDAEAYASATPRLGIVRCSLPADRVASLVSRVKSEMPDCTVIFEKLPAPLWQALSPTVISDRLSTDIRRAFDPHGILNPGILGSE
jgi:glycolate oxidase FAD binding subunit